MNFVPQRNETETEYKLRLLAKRYRAKVPRNRFTPAVRAQHYHMFGLSILDGGRNSISPERSRSGLIVTEYVLGLLSLSGFDSEGMAAMAKDVALHDWAPIVFGQWQLQSAEATPGRWWAVPLVIADSNIPQATMRSALLGIEAMELIDKRRASAQPRPKSRANLIRVTAEGEAFLELLLKGRPKK